MSEKVEQSLMDEFIAPQPIIDMSARIVELLEKADVQNDQSSRVLALQIARHLHNELANPIVSFILPESQKEN